MGTAKYDHPGYIADTGETGKYYVGVWCPHGYPAHVHIGWAQEHGASEPGIRLRFPDGTFQSLSDDFETLCRRAIGQALAERLLNGNRDEFQETRLKLDTAPWAGPMQAVVAKPAVLSDVA